MPDAEFWGDPRGGNQGMVTATGGGVADLIHNTTPGRTAKITKIMCYLAGAGGTLTFGTNDRTVAGALFVQLLPPLLFVAGIDNEWMELEIPALEFASDTTIGAAGRTGQILVLASVANVMVNIEVREKGS